jgi:hypothetical protein
MEETKKYWPFQPVSSMAETRYSTLFLSKEERAAGHDSHLASFRHHRSEARSDAHELRIHDREWPPVPAQDIGVDRSSRA